LISPTSQFRPENPFLPRYQRRTRRGQPSQILWKSRCRNCERAPFAKAWQAIGEVDHCVSPEIAVIRCERAEIENQISILRRGTDCVENPLSGSADVVEVHEILALKAYSHSAVILTDNCTACLYVPVRSGQTDNRNGVNLTCPQNLEHVNQGMASVRHTLSIWNPEEINKDAPPGAPGSIDLLFDPTQMLVDGLRRLFVLVVPGYRRYLHQGRQSLTHGASQRLERAVLALSPLQYWNVMITTEHFKPS
jgi:hypothetical protein